MKFLVSVLPAVLFLSAEVMSASIISIATVTSSNAASNCVSQFAQGTTSASVEMPACFDAPPWIPDPPESYPTEVIVTTAFGYSRIHYEGGSEIDGQFSEGWSQYSEWLQFAGAGLGATTEIFATYAITNDFDLDCSFPMVDPSLSLHVNTATIALSPCESGEITIDLGSWDTSQRFLFTAGLLFNAYGERTNWQEFEAQLLGFEAGPAGGSPDRPITATVVPEPGTLALLAIGLVTLLTGKRMGRGGGNQRRA